jgi:hypothetical protein
VQLAFLFCGNCFHRNRADECNVAVNHPLSGRLKSTPESPVANRSIHDFKTESARNEHWRFSLEPEFLPATSAFLITDGPRPFRTNDLIDGSSEGYIFHQDRHDEAIASQVELRKRIIEVGSGCRVVGPGVQVGP